MSAPYPSFPRPAGGRGFAVLGFLAALGLLYLAFVLLSWAATLERAVLVSLAAAFVGGFLSRTGGRGAKVGFVVLFLPVFLFGALLLASSLTGGEVAGSEPPVLLENLGALLGEVLLAALGIALVVLSLLAGVVGLVVGGLGGWLGGRLFPLDRGSPAYASWDEATDWDRW